jgi:hypothetical protein
MNRTVNLALNNFPYYPGSLCHPTNGWPLDELVVDFHQICHHMFIDSYGEPVQTPNGLYALYAPMLNQDLHFRFRESGVGNHKEVRVGEYNKFGKAFCRWFLHEHCNITYFAHVDDILNRKLTDNYSGFRVERVEEGNTPDYFCASNPMQMYFAEAKGTANSISFNNRKFDEWRQQFKRVTLVHPLGDKLSIKGYLVATRLVSEIDSPRVKSILLAEDPDSAGDVHSASFDGRIGILIIAGHYYSILEKLRLNLMASAIRDNLRLPADLRFAVGIWECLVFPARGLQFVGGYYSPNTDYFNMPPVSMPIMMMSKTNRAAHLNLSAIGYYFFGLELKTFLGLRRASINGRGDMDAQPLNLDRSSNDSLVITRDGAVTGPLDYFRLVDIAEI